MTKQASVTWDEPAGAASPRGWLHTGGGNCVGFYLDYGPGHYRSEHVSVLNTINGPIERVWCKPGDLCRDCQPGNILAVRYPGGPGSTPRDSAYFETASAARDWVESGMAAANDHLYQVVAGGVALAKFAGETDAQDYADKTHIPGLAVSVVQAY
jgi:hypothetical protein